MLDAHWLSAVVDQLVVLVAVSFWSRQFQFYVVIFGGFLLLVIAFIDFVSRVFDNKHMRTYRARCL